MTVRTTDRPDPEREDSRFAFFSKWRRSAPDGPEDPSRSGGIQAALDAVAAVWERDPWPSPGLLGYHLCTGEDGETLLHYSQWTGEDAYEAYVRDHRRARVDEIDAAVPGIERLGIGRFQLYRSGTLDSDARAPGCIVIVDVEFEGPDPDRQRAWVDTVFEALQDDPQLPRGGISSHFHLGTDGTRVLNYAEWDSAQAHIAAVEAPGRGIGSPTELWKRVQEYPGLKGSTVQRFLPAFSLVPG